MRPRKLILENIGPFRGREELDFSRLGDIFLITGKTGSGKSTIFDALCYALYGNLCGSRKGQIRKLRSDFASRDESCSVILEFELGKKAYRVERQPPRLRQKSRGDGFVEDGEEAALFEIQGTTLIPLSGKKTEADEKIQALVGLSSEEFSKIVLLPQGEFAEFLRQGTRERGEVLKKLFPVDLALRVQERALDTSREAATRLSEAERTVRDILSHFTPDTFDEDHRLAVRALTETEERTRGIEKQGEETAILLHEAERHEETAKNLRDAEKALSYIEERDILAAADRKRLADSRSARPLEALLIRAREAGARTALRETEQSSAKGAWAVAQRAAAETAAEAGREQELEAGLRLLLEKKGPLEEAVSIERETIGQNERRSALEGEIAVLREQGEKARSKQQRNNEERTALEARAARLEEAEKQWDAARTELEKAKARREQADQIGPLLAEKKAIEESRASAEASSLEAAKTIAVLRAELSALEEKKKTTEMATAAASLAFGLEKGRPCPVCGSPEHPIPAMAPPMAFGLDERIKALKTAIEDAAKNLAALEAEVRSAGREAERVERSLQVLAERMGEPLEGLPSPEEAARNLSAIHTQLNAWSTDREDARRAQNALSALFREQEAIRSAMEGAVANLNRKEQEKALLVASIAQTNARREKALGGLTGESAETALRRCLSEIETFEQKLKALRTRRDETARGLSAAEERLRGAQKAQDEAAAAGAAAARELDEALKRSTFASQEELSKALLPAQEEQSLDALLESLTDEKRRAQARRAEAGKNLQASAGKRPEGYPSAEALTAELERIKEEKDGARARRDAAREALSLLEREHETYLAAEQRRAVAASQASGLKRLSDDLSGKNPKNRSFDAWLLGLYLEEVTSYASHRLQRMSEGRYRLILDSDREGRGLSGLDLAVFDAYTGHSRPCATLSGGESFMASISLALGLADSIQARSGGVRLDAIFIDEGFGSLDEASLDKAMGILDEIRDHRMVALISHVGEMKSRIPSRVEIQKTSSGSRILTPGRDDGL